ncbi:hypothetical protein [Rubus yellow net virus]|uniref:Uncharacterized protein n=1 Tax=Rubus yellow net virus TaxID=198310 RepID=A0A097DCX5_9VIRU|nr:hypothetical protein [Rubus yellow net virus]AIS93168.1 hypothetical protein [Rubus yellow net virus]
MASNRAQGPRGRTNQERRRDAREEGSAGGNLLFSRSCPPPSQEIRDYSPIRATPCTMAEMAESRRLALLRREEIFNSLAQHISDTVFITGVDLAAAKARATRDNWYADITPTLERRATAAWKLMAAYEEFATCKDVNV